ncbi:cyclopropane fatty-acyl-phospholipid synthase-like methyltransferase [Trinickia symbiotica]|uniref:SAM-dependent methyltransferase n=1 Tax=Trinickia symbiotica TaxID=863227 RepID=A0A2N7WTE2_9BURK|nr:class I SAM-dependent methyltransferase [Trinickia symbiotica]PMS32748.1 SAM-dependent methyltransferase [Trinickia symbiotica]PPK42160.1 cyclopropane fatty-acyl-phospholipid synthase-like methyltransferase [Trinickia symbiotica]
MDTPTQRAQTHYGGAGLMAKVQAALAAFGPEETVLTVSQLAMLDQFHTRGMLATGELAEAMELEAGMAVLDLGCGIGGPTRYLAANYGVHVTGVDLSPSFVDTARYLSQRCALGDSTTFLTGDATQPPVADGSIDRVFLQHVAMNIADRAALYRAIRRVLKPAGRFATYDIVAKDGAPHFPVPWATTPENSHLRTEAETRDALTAAGFTIDLWRDDTEVASQWFAKMVAGGPPAGPTLALVLGADFPAMMANLARSLREGRIGVLTAIASCR